jgi:hypothetical protein
MIATPQGVYNGVHNGLAELGIGCADGLVHTYAQGPKPTLHPGWNAVGEAMTDAVGKPVAKLGVLARHL